MKFGFAEDFPYTYVLELRNFFMPFNEVKL